MTANFLASELANLALEAKRKYPDLRTSVDKLVTELKTFSDKPEQDVIEELRRRPAFVASLIKAVQTKNGKVAGIGVVCLQRLIIARAVPSTSLKEILDSFVHVASLGTDIQLKILQSLPPLLRNFVPHVQGELLYSTLEICFSLQSSKNAIINNTAAATLQQLVVTVFDNVSASPSGAEERELEIDAKQQKISAAAFDAYSVFRDLCLLTEGRKPDTLKSGAILQPFGLELLESVLSNHMDTFDSHEELVHVLRTQLMPFLIKSLSERTNFPTTVRVVRNIYVLLRRYLDIVPFESETALALLTHTIDPDAAPLWKRALCMEVFRGLYAEPDLIRFIYAKFDDQEGRQNIVRENMAAFVRLATEKPNVIGLGQATSDPTQFLAKEQNNEGTKESGVSGIIGGVVGRTDHFTPGISSQWSVMKIPCIDQLDKTDPPSIPDSYIYSLNLVCMNNFSEGLAKFVLPLTIPSETKGKRRKGAAKRARMPVNPLTLQEHPQYTEIKSCAALIDNCWPAILATSSTFLNAALDSDYYHGLVRSIQKFTHVSGLLELETPRDAFLTTLGKAAVPSHTSSNPAMSPQTEVHGLFANAKTFLNVDHLVGSPVAEHGQPFPGDSSLSARNVLCLRALLNIGVALGAMMGSAWTIIFDVLCQADIMLSSPTVRNVLGSDLGAVDTAASRMIEVTVDFNNEAFITFLGALCRPLAGFAFDNPEASVASPGKDSRHRRASSINTATTTKDREQEELFAISKIEELTNVNIERLISEDRKSNGWDFLTQRLISVIASSDHKAKVRFRAMSVLNSLLLETFKRSLQEDDEFKGILQDRALETLQQIVDVLFEVQHSNSQTQGTDAELHRSALDTLKSLLEHFGDSLIAGWAIVFRVIRSVFRETANEQTPDDSAQSMTIGRSTRLTRSSFASLQLICSDFLSLVPQDCMLSLVDSLSKFCRRAEDVNISLTAVTFLWNVSDFLMAEVTMEDLDAVAKRNHTAETFKALDFPQDAAELSTYRWMVLLLHLADITVDSRPEIRDGAIQTLFRIFEAHGAELSPKSWRMCLSTIVLRVLEAYFAQLSQLPATRSLSSDESGWLTSSILVLTSTGTLLEVNLSVIADHESFIKTWLDVLRSYEKFFDLQFVDINDCIFRSIGGILSRMNEQSFTRDFYQPVWVLWSSHGIPTPPDSRALSPSSVQNALSNFVICFNELYKASSEKFTLPQVETALGLFQDCLLHPSDAPSFSDVDHLTPLQKLVAESVKELKANVHGVPSAIIKFTADVIALPFSIQPEVTIKRLPEGKKHSFIALSVLMMRYFEDFLLKNVTASEIYSTGAFTQALKAMCRPVQLKYRLLVTRKATPPWVDATKVLLSLLNSSALGAEISKTDTSIQQAILTEVVDFAVAIIESPPETDAGFATADEDFDIASFKRIRQFLHTALGRAALDKKVRSMYAEKVFLNSLVHVPTEGDLPSIHNSDILKGVYVVRRGSTSSPRIRPRPQMSYLCLDELFQMVSASDEQQIRIAQSAAPFLILRCAMSLRAYIADQPLRGAMPQPFSLRKEILYILQNLTDMKTEPRAIPDTPGLQSNEDDSAYRKHIHRLYPLLTKAVTVSQRDQRIVLLLSELVQTVGDDLGV